VHKRHHIIVKK